MQLRLPDFADELRTSVRTSCQTLSQLELLELLERGEQWKLGSTLASGGSILFPHAPITSCGHQIAAAAQAALDSGADRLLVIGVLHALTEPLWEARNRMLKGADVLQDPMRGIQGPELNPHRDWEAEFSLVFFLFLLKEECRRRGCSVPEVILRFPFLAAGHPETVPGVEELEALRSNCALLATGDLMHHGVIYGTEPEKCLPPGEESETLARSEIGIALDLLSQKEYQDYIAQCWNIRNDAIDVGQVLRHLIGPVEWTIHDLVCIDTCSIYSFPPPNWVAAPLVELKKK